MIMRLPLARYAALGITLFAAACSQPSPEAQLESAKAHIAKQEKKAAVIQLKNALQKRPKIAEARFLLGRLLLDTGDVPAAEKELRKALELGYSAQDVVPPLAHSLALLGQYAEVLDNFANVEIESADGRAEMSVAKGQAYLAKGDRQAALDAFAIALTANPDYVPAHLGRARVEASSGNIAEGIAIVDRALVIAPQSSEAWQLKAGLLLIHGQSEAALAAYRRAVDADPKSLVTHAAIISLLLKQSRVDEAAAQTNAMKRIAPQHALTLYHQALVAYTQRNFAAAQNAVEQQLRVLPDNLSGLLLAASIYLELKLYSRAEAYLIKVLDRVPEHFFARRTLMVAYLRDRQPVRALEVARPILPKIEKDSAMLALTGEIYMANGKSQEAFTYFNKAAALDPKDPTIRTSIAISHVAAGQTERGFDELEHIASTDSGMQADLALIAANMRRRAYDKALSAINDLEKKYPQSALPKHLRGQALLAKRELALARTSFEDALKIDPSFFPAISSLAQLDITQGNAAAGQQRLEVALARDPNNVNALLSLAALRLARAGNVSAEPSSSAARQLDKDVAGLIRKAIAAQPTDPTPRLALIDYYLKTKDPKRAVTAAQDAIAAFPDRPQVLDAAGLAHLRAGDTYQALATYKQLATLQSGSSYPYLRMAEVHLAARDIDAAVASLLQALTISPELLEAQRRLITLYVGAKRQNASLEVARRVQTQRPKEAVGYVFEAGIYASSNDWKMATAAYRAALERSPKSTDIALKLHHALLSSGAGAEGFETKWLADNPNDATFRFYLAQSASARQDYAGAAQHYQKLLELEPRNAAALNNLASAEQKLKLPQALEHAEQANRIAPNQPAIMDTLAALLVAKGETARGVEMLRKASDMAPEAPEIRLNLAKALIGSGQKDSARTELAKLAKLGEKFSRQKEVEQLGRGL